MNKVIRLLKLLPLIVVPFLPFYGHAQVKWVASPASDRSFIEDKGQFDGRNGLPGTDVLFAVEGGGDMIFFTKAGITYRFDQREKNKNRKRGDRSKPRFITTCDFVQMSWEGANPNPTIVGEDKAHDYHTYAHLGAGKVRREIENVIGFRKITYKNLYPNIDVEYVFHPETGIKYALILHPGADVSKVKMRFADGRNVQVSAEGNLQIATVVGDIIDHAPHTFYADSKNEVIASRFEVNENVVSFKLAGFNPARTVVIDPWTVAPPSLNSNKMWDVGIDSLGNVYSTGGDSPLRLRKYSPDGTLIWTYTTPYDSSNTWLGSMVTDKEGNCYLAGGSTASITKVNPLGQWVYTAQAASLALEEFWRLAFNENQTQLIVGGTRLNPLNPLALGFPMVFNVDKNTGQQIGNLQVAQPAPGLNLSGLISEVRALTYAPNGNYYFMSHDTIGSFTQGLELNCTSASTYPFSYKLADFGVDNMGVSAIAATGNYLYTQNGAKLHKRHLVSCDIIEEVSIPSGSYLTSTALGATLISPRNSGVIVDDCDNLYVGSGNAVHKFDSDLNLLASVTTPGAVYDVKVNHNGEVVASGAGFVISIDLTSCAPQSLELAECLQLGEVSGDLCNMTAITTYCVDSGLVSLTSNYPGGTWSGPGITNANNGSFDPAIAGVGTHTIQYSPLLPVPCGSETVDITVSLCGQPEICADSIGNLVVYNGTPPYQWQIQVEELDCSGCAVPLFCGTPLCPGEVVLVFQTDLIGNSYTPTAFPVQLIDAAGETILIDSLNQVTLCNQSCELTVDIINVQQTCVEGTIGSATAVVSNNLGNASFVWNTNPEQTTATATGLSAGSYIVNVSDAFGCTNADTVTIVEYPAVIAFAGSDTVICLGDTILLTASGGSSYLWNTGDSVAQISIAPVVTTQFDVLVIGEGACSDSAGVLIVVDERICLGIVPNVFNPDTDFEGIEGFCAMVHQNNTFQLPCLELYPGNRMRIFDRWGRERYDETNYHLNPWDGDGASDGVYYFVLEVPNIEAPLKGYFHIAH